MDIILETKDLTKTYKAGGNHINAVDHTSICVERGDFVTIVGKCGSGKCTLLHLIGGLDYPTSGEVWIDNECITNMNEEDLSAFRRRKIGFIFQAFNLVPSLNVWENIIAHAYEFVDNSCVIGKQLELSITIFSSISNIDTDNSPINHDPVNIFPCFV